jgi:hypothetical protein
VSNFNRASFLLIVIVVFFAAFSCHEEEDESICDQYCSASENCNFASGQMFSWSECQDECNEAMERHESIGCGDRMEEFYYCLINLPCPSWNEYGDRCSAEIDYLDLCVDGTS